MNIHRLKTWPIYFEAIWDDRKNFEVRKDDRHFAILDKLFLEEFDPERGDYSGRYIEAEITYVMRNSTFKAIEIGYVVMALRILHKSTVPTP
jgi:hypothetical protein